MSRLSAAALILLTGCIEQTFNTAGEAGAGSGAEIEVVPGSLSFGPLSSDDDALIKTVLIRSIGVADLTVEEITVSGTGAESFTLLTDSTRFVLPPGGEMALEVAFLPMGASEQAAVAIVSSNADLQPTLPVSLSGEGLVSELAITPSPLDFRLRHSSSRQRA